MSLDPASDDELRCEATFEVDRSPEDLWHELQTLGAERAPDTGWWMPGFESPGAEVSAEPGRRLIVTKVSEPCRGTTIAITFEHAGTGSRIRVVQSGFDAAFLRGAGDAFWTHARRILADAELWFRSGVDAGRAWRAWSPSGLRVKDRPFGAVVASMAEESWAARVGLEVGDVLIEFMGAPVFSGADVAVLEQAPRPGDDVRAVWVRGRSRLSGSARF